MMNRHVVQSGLIWGKNQWVNESADSCMPASAQHSRGCRRTRFRPFSMNLFSHRDQSNPNMISDGSKCIGQWLDIRAQLKVENGPDNSVLLRPLLQFEA